MTFKNKIPGLDHYLKFQSSTIKRLIWPYAFDDELIRWRAFILFSILFAGLILGTIAFIGALAAIVEKGVWGVAIADIAGIGLGLILLKASKIKFEIRAVITCLLFFFVGVMIILSIGPQIGGPVWLFAFSVLSGVLLGNLAALGAIFLNAIFLITICFLVLYGKLEYNMPFFKSPSDMIAAVSNFIIVNAITAISVSVLVRGVFEIYKERKRQEVKLKESERRFRDMAELMPETIFEVDIKGQLTFVNKRAFDLFGYTTDDFQNGVNVFDLICEKDKERAFNNVGKIIQGRNVGINEYEVLKKDGTSFPALFHSSAIYNDGNVSGLRGFLIDITEKKQTQAHLIQSEKMMSVGGLAAGMAHEINNPLAGMMQNAQVIHNRLTKELEINRQAAHKLGTDIETIQKFMENRGVLKQLNNINNAGKQAAKIVNNMLSFAKQSESNWNENRLDELIDKSIELAENDYSLRKNYDFRQIRIIREYQDDIPLVACDPSKIQQVLFNIIKNASEAMREDNKTASPTITFRLKRGSGTAVNIEIEDNGPGIDDKIGKRIFEPFFTTKDIDKGTGLGLSVSYFIIVNDHKGSLEFESQVGKGTKFLISLPAPAVSGKFSK